MTALSRPLNRSGRTLPVWATIDEVYTFAWHERLTIVRLSWCPLLLAAIAWFYAEHAAALFAAKILGIATTAIVTVALHRVILFGDRQRKAFLNLHFGVVEALFAALPLAFFLATTVLVWLGVPLEWHVKGGPALVGFVIIAVVVFFFVRFCLIFPIAVVERRLDFAQAWALSHGNVCRMIAVWIAVTAPAYMVIGMWQWLLLTVLGLTPFAMTAEQFDGSLLEALAVTYPTSIILGALCVGILSHTYKALAGFGAGAVLRPAA